jgi:hypothetical protein
MKGRTDLHFEFSTGVRKPWPYFAVESKRLHVTFPSGWKSLVSEYVTSDQGVMCFVSGRYATDLDSGAMLGYVFDERVDDARSAISVSMRENQALLKTLPPHCLVQSTIVAGCTDIHETTHSLAPRAFTIYHLFVAV